MALLCGLTGPASAQATTTPAPAEQTVPFRVVKSLGNRPAVNVRINDFPVRLVVHSNAGFLMQLSHEAARRGSITNLVHRDDYGIASPGTVSKLGRDSAFVGAFNVGRVTYRHGPVSVFETPSPFNVGMLGMRWLRTSRAVVDYRKNHVVLYPQPATTEHLREQLLRDEYVALPLQHDPTDGRYLTPVTIDTVTRPLVVSTIGDVIFDSEFARLAHLPQQATSASYGGPSGTTGQIYALTNPVTVRLGTLSYLIPAAKIEDTYAYAAAQRPAAPALARGGALGADFLIAHKAVVDFGNAVLYVKK